MLKTMLLSAAILGATTAGVLAAGPYDGIFPVPTGWGGFYTGINGGYAEGRASDGGTTFPDISLAGAFVGGQAGYNFVLKDMVVVGLQSDVDWSWETGSYSAASIGSFADATLTDTINWTGALTGHLGVTTGPLMAYALGGAVFAGNTLHNIGVDKLGGASPIEADVTQAHVGWTAGAGLSALMGPVSAFVEYRYSDFGTADYHAAVGSDPVRLTDQQVRVGLNYHMR